MVLRVRILTQAAGVVPIYDRAAGINHVVAVFGNGQWEMLPVHHVGADGVAPTHVSPHLALGVELIKEVVLTLVEDHPVGIVHEVLGRREVILGPPRLVIRILSGKCGRH